MEHRTIKPKNDALVVRHNKLIEARYETTLQQQRIMLWLISEIRPEDRDFQKYRVTIKELARFVGLQKNKNIYQEIAKATEGMVGRVVVIRDTKNDTDFTQVGLIRMAEHKIASGYIDLSINPELMPYLLDLKANFTTAYLRDLLAMKSAYSIRLYDLINQYRKIGERVIEITDLKEILGIEKKYKDYKNLKARVIVPAVEEINARTDLLVSYTERKNVRTVTALKFQFSTKKGFQISKETTDIPAGNEEIFERLRAHGIKDKEAQKYIELYGETDPSRITGNLEKLEEGILAGKVKVPGAWLRQAIDQDYRDQKSLFQKNNAEAEREAGERRKEQREKEQQLADIERQMEAQQLAYLKYRQGFIGSIVDSIPADEREVWDTEFGASLDGYFKKEWVKSQEWSSRLHVTRAEQFIEKKLGRTCQSEDVFYLENGYRVIEDLEEQRQGLL